MFMLLVFALGFVGHIACGCCKTSRLVFGRVFCLWLMVVVLTFY